MEHRNSSSSIVKSVDDDFLNVLICQELKRQLQQYTFDERLRSLESKTQNLKKNAGLCCDGNIFQKTNTSVLKSII